MQFENEKFHKGKEVRIYTSFSDASDGGCRVGSLVPLLITLRVKIIAMPQNLSFLENVVEEAHNIVSRFFPVWLPTRLHVVL